MGLQFGICTLNWFSPPISQCNKSFSKAKVGTTKPFLGLLKVTTVAFMSRVLQFKAQPPLNNMCYVKLVACPSHCASYHPRDGALTPREGFLIFFFFFFNTYKYFTFTVPQAPSLTGISLGEQSAMLACSPPDRPRHGLHANCGGVASMRRPCVA